jgi:hypothetical protein
VQVGRVCLVDLDLQHGASYISVIMRLSPAGS